MIRLGKNFFSEKGSLVDRYNATFDDLMEDFRNGATRETLVVVHRIWEVLAKQDQSRQLCSGIPSDFFLIDVHV